MTPSLRAALSAPLLLLGACGGAEVAPGGLSEDESAELNDAAAMLDNASVSANAVAPTEERP